MKQTVNFVSTTTTTNIIIHQALQWVSQTDQQPLHYVSSCDFISDAFCARNHLGVDRRSPNLGPSQLITIGRGKLHLRLVLSSSAHPKVAREPF